MVFLSNDYDDREMILTCIHVSDKQRCLPPASSSFQHAFHLPFPTRSKMTVLQVLAQRNHRSEADYISTHLLHFLKESLKVWLVSSKANLRPVPTTHHIDLW